MQKNLPPMTITNQHHLSSCLRVMQTVNTDQPQICCGFVSRETPAKMPSPPLCKYWTHLQVSLTSAWLQNEFWYLSDQKASPVVEWERIFSSVFSSSWRHVVDQAGPSDMNVMLVTLSTSKFSMYRNVHGHWTVTICRGDLQQQHAA